MNTCVYIKGDSNLRNIDVDIHDYIVVNDELNAHLIEWKNKIDDNKSWDTAKRLFNTYEFIFSSGYNKESVSKKKPLSRSYFKLWEILHDFNLIESNSISAHIAEGPGGFIECVCDYKNKYAKNCEMYGITLKSNNKKIPSWKIPKCLIDNNDIHLYNEDDGNIYNIQTVEKFIKFVGENSCDIVTSDGGFDFSADFNNQETHSLQLMLSEIYITLMIQKQKGSMLIKVFDLFSIRTIKLIALCSDFYENFVIIKPQTSRPANSEKYILFKNFLHDDNNSTQCHNLKILRHCIQTNDLEKIDTYSNFQNIMVSITKYNMYYTFNQINALQKTLDLSKEINNANSNSNHQNNKHYILDNIQVCKNWCNKYNIETY